MFKNLLLAAITLEITPLDVAGALLDETARRSTLKPTYSQQIGVRAQFRWTARLARDTGAERGDVRGAAGTALPGAKISSIAQAVITRIDADRAGYEPRMGDRVVGVVDRRRRRDNVNLYVVRATPVDEQQGGFSDLLILLSDRHPGRAATS